MALGSVKIAPAFLGSQAFAEIAALSSRYEANTSATCGSTRTRVFDQPRFPPATDRCSACFD